MQIFSKAAYSRRPLAASKRNEENMRNYNQLINNIKGWDFSKIEIDEVLNSDNVLLNPSIDLTNACNLNCIYCYIEEKNSTRKKRKPNELTLQETFQTIDAFTQLKAKTINIVGAGEPTIDQYFYEIVDYINSKGLNTVLFTNGLRFLTDKEMIPFIYNRNVSVILKYNSNNAKLQDAIVNKTGYSTKRDKVLSLLIKYNFNKPQITRLGIDTIAFKGNLKELPSIHKYCRENNIFPISANYIPTGRTDKGELQNNNSSKFIKDSLQPLSYEDSIWLLKQNKEIDKNFNIIWNDVIAYYNGGICPQILGLYVDIIGNIWPCVSRSKRINGINRNGLLGNIKKGDSILNIWSKNQYMQSIRKNFNGGCPYKELVLNINQNLSSVI